MRQLIAHPQFGVIVGAPVSAERNGKDERELTQLKELLEMYAFLDGAGNDEQ